MIGAGGTRPAGTLLNVGLCWCVKCVGVLGVLFWCVGVLGYTRVGRICFSNKTTNRYRPTAKVLQELGHKVLIYLCVGDDECNKSSG
jgi:hypothetical protein